MAISVGDAVLELGVDKKGFDKDMRGLSGIINRHKRAIGIGMAAIGAAAVGAAVASVKAFADMGDEVHKMALRTGFSTEALSEFRHVADISGTSLTSVEKAVKKMSKTIVDADEGMATYIRSFDRIGLSAEELMKLSPEEQFIRITEAIAALESPTLRAATAQDIFGRAGTELLPMMDAGADGIKRLREEAHELGIVFDEEAAESAANLTDNLTKLEGAVTGLKFALAKELAPTLEEIIPTLIDLTKNLVPLLDIFTKPITGLNQWIKDMQVLHSSFIPIEQAWIWVMEERTKSLKGLDNEYERSLDLLEEVLRRRGKLDDQAQYTINHLRREIGARVLVKEAIEEETEAIEELTEAQIEQIKLQEEQNELREETAELIKETIEELEYERSAAGELYISVKDVIKALHLMGKEDEYITRVLVGLGDEQDNVLRVMEAFGISVEEVADILGLQTDEVERLKLSYEELDETLKKTAKSAADLKAALDIKVAAGEKLTEAEILAYQRAATAEAAAIKEAYPGISWAEAQSIAHGQAIIVDSRVVPTGVGAIQAPISGGGMVAPGVSVPTEEIPEEVTEQIYDEAYLDLIDALEEMQHGGIAMHPITARIAEKRPEAVIPLDKTVLERLGLGKGTADIRIYLDKRIMAQALGQPLVDIIRVRQGLKV